MKLAAEVIPVDAPFVLNPGDTQRPLHNAPTVTWIPTYEFSDGTIVSFRRAKHVAGMSHRVLIDGLAVDYLQENMRPSAASARLFYEKYSAKL